MSPTRENGKALKPDHGEIKMAGYALHHYNILDVTRIDELGPLTLPIAEKYGAEIMIASPAKALKGKTDHSHMVVYKLKNFDAALAFYHSPELAELAEFRDQVIEGFSMVLPGHEETEAVVTSGYFQPSNSSHRDTQTD